MLYKINDRYIISAENIEHKTPSSFGIPVPVL